MDAEATVFVVDSDLVFVESTSGLLKTHGLVVETYRSATEFLEMHDSRKPGCLVLAARMPGMKGLQLFETLVTDGECLPVIFVADDGDVAASVWAMKLGAFDYLQKPIPDRKLLVIVHAAIEEDRQRRRLERERCEVQSRLESLTFRQREVMGLLAQGKTVKKIGGALGISNKTVSRHRARILAKLQVDGEVELVRLLANHGIDLPR